MSTQINITVNSGNLLDIDKQHRSGMRLSKAEEDSRIATSKTAVSMKRKTEAKQAITAAKSSSDNFIRKRYKPYEPVTHAIIASIGYFLTETGFLDAGQAGSERRYVIGAYSKLANDNELYSDISAINNPAWKIQPSISKQNLVSEFYLPWEKSQNCGGLNGNVQQAQIKVAAKSTPKVFVRLKIEGRGEPQATGFETLIVNRIINNQLIPIGTARSNGGDQGCAAAGPVGFIDLVSDTYTSWDVLGGGIAIVTMEFNNVEGVFLQLDLSTVDNLYHVDAYYRISISVANSKSNLTIY